MKNVWRLIYGTLFALSLLVGTGIFRKSDYSKTLTDWYALGPFALVGLAFPFLMLWQAHLNGLTPVPAPSFDRGIAGGFRTDPLQWTRLGSVLFFGSLAGGLIALNNVNPVQPLMAACMNGSFAVGLGVGELICRRAFARLISNRRAP